MKSVFILTYKKRCSFSGNQKKRFIRLAYFGVCQKRLLFTQEVMVHFCFCCNITDNVSEIQICLVVMLWIMYQTYQSLTACNDTNNISEIPVPAGCNITKTVSEIPNLHFIVILLIMYQTYQSLSVCNVTDNVSEIPISNWM